MRTQTRRAIAEQLAEVPRDGRGHQFALREDVVKVLARNAEERSDLGLAFALVNRRDRSRTLGFDMVPIDTLDASATIVPAIPPAFEQEFSR